MRTMVDKTAGEVFNDLQNISNFVGHQSSEIVRYREALEKIRSVVGTSTEAWHFADDALNT